MSGTQSNPDQPGGRKRRTGLLAAFAGYVPPGEEEDFERRWYRVTSLSVFATAALAFLSGTALATLALELSWPLPLVVGAGWSLLILLVDALIIRQVRYLPVGGGLPKALNVGGGVLTFLLRLGLTVGTAILITEPVMIYVFRDVIQAQVEIDAERAARQAQIADLAGFRDAIAVRRSQAAGQQREIDQRDGTIRGLEQAMATERKGQGASGIVGRGEEYLGLQERRDGEVTKLATVKDTCADTVAAIRTDVSKKLGGVDKAFEADKKRRIENAGYLQRRTALAAIEDVAGRSGESPDSVVARQLAEATLQLSQLSGGLPACTPGGGADTAPLSGGSPAAAPANAAPAAVGGATAGAAAPGEEIQRGVSEVESRTIRLQHVVLAGVLIIVDLLPLSIKMFGGGGPLSLRVRRAAAGVMTADAKAAHVAVLRARFDLKDALLDRKREHRQLAAGFRDVRQHDRVMAIHRFREMVAALFGRVPAPDPPAVPAPDPPDPIVTPGPTPSSPNGVPSSGNGVPGQNNGVPGQNNGVPGQNRTPPPPPPPPTPTPTPPPAPDPGNRVVADRWEIVSPLNGTASKYARLWRVRRVSEQDDGEGRWVLKEFQMTDHGREEIKAVFDIWVSQGKIGQYLAPIVDLGPDSGGGTGNPRGYFVTPYYPERDLQTYLDQHPVLSRQRSLELCLEWSYQIMYGLNEVYRTLRRAHNDVKPQNVGIELNDAAALHERVGIRLLDWGLSAVTGDDTGRKIFGTPFYAPPERWRGEPGVCAPLVDVYGAGATLYWMLTGLQPLWDVARDDGLLDDVGRFRNERAAVAFLRQGRSPTPVQHLVRTPLPPGVTQLVDRWVNPDPAARVLRAGFALKAEDLDNAHYWALKELYALVLAARSAPGAASMVGPEYATWTTQAYDVRGQGAGTGTVSDTRGTTS